MILKRGFFKKTIRQRLSEIEISGKETKPLVNLYSKKQVKKMFSKFKERKIYTRHLDIRLSGRRINKFLNLILVKRFLEGLSKRFRCI